MTGGPDAEVRACERGETKPRAYLADPLNPNSLSTWFRRRRDVALRSLIGSIAAATGGPVNILDMGGTFEYWDRVGLDFLREKRARIVLLNLLATDPCGLAGVEDLFECALGDACRLPQVRDRQFDLAHSNSVIEHVETWSRMKAFAAETRRVARCYYLQTPYFWFPIDPHYHRMPMFHWFPRPIRARLLNALPIAYTGRIAGVDRAFDVVDHARLLDGRQFRFLFPDAEIRFERFAGVTKSLIAVRGLRG